MRCSSHCINWTREEGPRSPALGFREVEASGRVGRPEAMLERDFRNYSRACFTKALERQSLVNSQPPDPYTFQSEPFRRLFRRQEPKQTRETRDALFHPELHEPQRGPRLLSRGFPQNLNRRGFSPKKSRGCKNPKAVTWQRQLSGRNLLLACKPSACKKTGCPAFRDGDFMP